MTRNDANFFHASIYEAGRAVIARVLGLHCDGATIFPNNTQEGAPVVDDPSAYRARIYTHMAGSESEIEILGNCACFDGDDRDQIERIGAKLVAFDEAMEAQFRRVTRTLIQRHAEQIIAVAAALFARETLSSAEIDAMVKVIKHERAGLLLNAAEGTPGE